MFHVYAKSEIQSLPWYRYPMVWFVIMLPMSVVVASFITIAIAFNHAPQLVPVPDLANPAQTNTAQGKRS